MMKYLDAFIIEEKEIQSELIKFWRKAGQVWKRSNQVQTKLYILVNWFNFRFSLL